MREVAGAAGVAVSTVSKALRNDPTLPETRCREIQALATRLGYRPHPLVATLMAQLHHHRRRNDPHSLAWIDLWPAVSGPAVAIPTEPILEGARERAGELGYRIEVYHPGRENLTPDRLARLLTDRGQWGVIIPPVPEAYMRFPLDLRGLAAVTIGTSLQEPVMHRVSPNHFQGCTLALQQLRTHGFRRMGLVLSPAMNKRTEGKWLGAFLAVQAELNAPERLAPLLASPEDRPALATWLEREQPEVILVAETFPWPSVRRGLQPGGKLPARAWLMLPPAASQLSAGGLDYRPEQLGRVAVEMVVAQIHRNERGRPLTPQTVLIDAIWQAPRQPRRIKDTG